MRDNNEREKKKKLILRPLAHNPVEIYGTRSSVENIPEKRNSITIGLGRMSRRLCV